MKSRPLTRTTSCIWAKSDSDGILKIDRIKEERAVLISYRIIALWSAAKLAINLPQFVHPNINNHLLHFKRNMQNDVNNKWWVDKKLAHSHSPLFIERIHCKFWYNYYKYNASKMEHRHYIYIFALNRLIFERIYCFTYHFTACPLQNYCFSAKFQESTIISRH